MAAVVGLGLTLSAPAIAHENADTLHADLDHIIDVHIPVMKRTGLKGYCEEIDHAYSANYESKMSDGLKEHEPDYKIEFHENYEGYGPAYCIIKKGKAIWLHIVLKWKYYLKKL